MQPLPYACCQRNRLEWPHILERLKSHRDSDSLGYMTQIQCQNLQSTIENDCWWYSMKSPRRRLILKRQPCRNPSHNSVNILKTWSRSYMIVKGIGFSIDWVPVDNRSFNPWVSVHLTAGGTYAFLINLLVQTVTLQRYPKGGSIGFKPFANILAIYQNCPD
jgi:hypothetical protein